MSEFDELVSRHGVLVAGRLGPDGRVVAHKNPGLIIEDPAVFELMTSFSTAVQTMLNTMALAMSHVGAVPEWQPMKGWSVSSGIYSFTRYGERFVVTKTDKVESFDELRRLLEDNQS